LLVYGDKGQKNISKEFGYRIEQRDRQHRYGLINMFLTLVCHCKVGALGVSDASVSLEHRIGLVAFRHDDCYTMIDGTLVDFFLAVYHEPKM
jgi:hypothetical protein